MSEKLVSDSYTFSWVLFLPLVCLLQFQGDSFFLILYILLCFILLFSLKCLLFQVSYQKGVDRDVGGGEEDIKKR